MSEEALRHDGARWPMVVIVLVGIAALVLRSAGLVGGGGPLAAPTGYDDGVYFSSAALMTRGAVPYRDFAFVHPPGLLYFLAATSAWMPDPSKGFAVSRFVAAATGGANTVLAGAVALRAAGPVAGIVASVLYAVYPDAVNAERSPYLEPLLNFFSLLLALVWLKAGTGSRVRPIVAGVLCAAACAVKVWGGIWLVAALVSAEKGRFRSDALRFFITAAVTGLVLVGPFLLLAPSSFIEQTLLFHGTRPPDGVISKAERLPLIAGAGHAVSTVLAGVAILFMLVKVFRDRRSMTRTERFFVVAAALTVVAFLASSCYWNHYNSHLAASQCVLAGLGAAALVRMGPRLVLVPLLALAIGWFEVPVLRATLASSKGRDHAQLAIGSATRAGVAEGASVFAFEPVWSLAGGHLPPHGDGAPVIVDSYGVMLMASPRGAPEAYSAFQQSDVSQGGVRARLEKSRYLILGWRGNWQLNAENKSWVAANFACVPPGAGDLCLRVRRDKPFASLAEAGAAVEFGEGWFGEEGTPPDSWRWMRGTSHTTLPAASGKMRLELHLQVPVGIIREPITVVAAVDGREVDRFRAEAPDMIRTLTIDGTGAPQQLTLTTDRTFVPSALGLGADDRELGLRLNRLLWVAEK